MGERATFPPTKAQRRILDFVNRFGGVIDFGGRDGVRSDLAAARECIENGWLAGSERRAGITEAGRAGITKSHMWELEQGRSVNPTIATVNGLAKALGIPFVELAAGALNDTQR